MKKCFLVFILNVLNTHLCFSETSFLKTLGDSKRFGDLYHLSLQGMNSKNLSKANLHRRNAARASLQIGDFESSIFFLRENMNKTSYKENVYSPERLLLAYNYLLLGTLSMWEPVYIGLNDFDSKRMLIVQSIDGPRSSKALKAFETLADDEDLNSQTRENIREYLDSPQKSPALAGILNLLAPGGGYAYLGMWQTAALSFLLTGLCTMAAREQFLDRKVYTGTAIAMVGSVFYLGGTFGAVHSAQDYNQKMTAEPRKKLREFAFPELKMEWNF